MKLKLKDGSIVDTAMLLARLDADGNTGADMSPGDPTAKAAAALIREFMEKSPRASAMTVACICKWSPAKMRAHSECMNEDFAINQGLMNLDHRCEFHGEKAQPKLWGRHKELELLVTPTQWLALGLEDIDPGTREGRMEALLTKVLLDAEYALNPQPHDRNMPIGLDLRSLVYLIKEALK